MCSLHLIIGIGRKCVLNTGLPGYISIYISRSWMADIGHFLLAHSAKLYHHHWQSIVGKHACRLIVSVGTWLNVRCAEHRSTSLEAVDRFSRDDILRQGVSQIHYRDVLYSKLHLISENTTKIEEN